MSGEATRQPPALGNGVRRAPPFCPGAMERSKSSQSISAALVRPVWRGVASRRTRGVPMSWKAAGCVTRTPTWHLASAEIQSQLTWGTRLLVCQANLDPVAGRQDKIHRATCFEASRFHRRHFSSQHGKAVSSGRVTVYGPASLPLGPTPNNRPSAPESPTDRSA